MENVNGKFAVVTAQDVKDAFAVVESQGQAVEQVKHSMIGVQNAKSQTLTLLYQDGQLDVLSQRSFGNQWRRSITIHPENLDTLIKGLQAIKDAQRKGKLAATVTIRDGAILK